MQPVGYTFTTFSINEIILYKSSSNWTLFNMMPQYMLLTIWNTNYTYIFIVTLNLCRPAHFEPTMKHRSPSLSLFHKHTHRPAHKDAFVYYAEQTHKNARCAQMWVHKYIILKP